MSIREVENIILELAEEDRYGLWEIGWRVRQLLGIDPCIDPTEVAGAVGALRARGLVDVFVRDRIDNSTPAVDAGGLPDLFATDTWDVPAPDHRQYLIGIPSET